MLAVVVPPLCRVMVSLTSPNCGATGRCMSGASWFGCFLAPCKADPQRPQVAPYSVAGAHLGSDEAPKRVKDRIEKDIPEHRRNQDSHDEV